MALFIIFLNGILIMFGQNIVYAQLNESTSVLSTPPVPSTSFATTNVSSSNIVTTTPGIKKYSSNIHLPSLDKIEESLAKYIFKVLYNLETVMETTVLSSIFDIYNFNVNVLDPRIKAAEQHINETIKKISEFGMVAKNRISTYTNNVTACVQSQDPKIGNLTQDLLHDVAKCLFGDIDQVISITVSFIQHLLYIPRFMLATGHQIIGCTNKTRPHEMCFAGVVSKALALTTDFLLNVATDGVDLSLFIINLGPFCSKEVTAAVIEILTAGEHVTNCTLLEL